MIIVFKMATARFLDVSEEETNKLKENTLLYQAGGLSMWMKSRAGFQRLTLSVRMAVQMNLSINQLNQEVSEPVLST